MSAIGTLLEWATAMDTAKQAMENMEYVRRLLEEKQAGFSASVELAVSFIHRQIEWPEETMEMMLLPGRHETIEEQDPVHEWRAARLARLGIPGRWPKLPPAMSTGTGWRRLYSGGPSVARTPHPPLIQAGD
jgi:hypothetical protein